LLVGAERREYVTTHQYQPLFEYNAEQWQKDCRAEERAHRCGDLRTQEQLREHYLIECELADRLRQAPRPQRRGLYCEVYDELFRRVSHHPQLQPAVPGERQREVDGLLAFLRRFLTPATVFMEVGPGDCALSVRAARAVDRVYAVDVSKQITRTVTPPANFKLVLSDGCSIDVPEGSVNVAFSDQLMEHLHPDDANEQLQNIYRSLAPGGIYICFTPNRHYGPHDISMYFSQFACGFHLREYTGREIHRLFKQAGFADVRFYATARGRSVRCPYWLVALSESIIDWLPRGLGKLIAHTGPMRALLGLRVAAAKPGAVAG
jgi:SAM-dependent methyltransferase